MLGLVTVPPWHALRDPQEEEPTQMCCDTYPDHLPWRVGGHWFAHRFD